MRGIVIYKEEVRRSIAIQISHDHLLIVVGGKNLAAGSEIDSISTVGHRHGGAAPIGQHDIRLTIAIDITNGHAGGIRSAEFLGGLRCSRTVALVDIHAAGARPGVGHDIIGISIAIQIPARQVPGIIKIRVRGKAGKDGVSVIFQKGIISIVREQSIHCTIAVHILQQHIL